MKVGTKAEMMAALMVLMMAEMMVVMTAAL